MISSLIGALIDSLLVECESCPLTAVFTEKVDVVHQVYVRKGRKIYTLSDI